MRALLDRWRLFSVREFATHRGRTLAAVTVMAVSAAFLVSVLGIFGSLTGSVDRLVGGLAGDASLEVTAVTDSGFPVSIRDDIAAIPGVAQAVPMVRTRTDSDRGSLLLLGADGSAATLGSALQGPVEHQLAALISTPDGVLAGPGVGVRAGEPMRLGSRTVTVAGVIEGGTAARLNEGHYVLTSLAVAQRVTQHPGRVDSVLIVAAPNTAPGELRSAVDTAVNGRALVAEPSVRAVQTGNGIRILQYMTLMGAALAFIVAAFLIYTTMSMAIAQRRPTISMLRAVGGQRRTIVADLLTEAAVVGFAGGLLGALIGIALGRMAVRSLPVALMQAVEARTTYSLPVYAIPFAVGAAVCTSVAASGTAAYQVYKVSPIEALAPVGASAADRIRPWLRRAALCAAIGDLVIAVGLIRLHLGSFLASGAALTMFFGAALTACFAAGDQLVWAAARVARWCGRAGELAAATLERAPRRVWATLMTVFMAVAVTVTITGANNDLLTGARTSLGSVGDVDVWVSMQPPDEYPTGALPSGLADDLAKLPGVATVTEGQLAYATLGDQKILLYGLADGSVSPLYQQVSDRTRAELVAGRGVVLSRDLSRALGAHAGDEITMRTPQGLQHIRVLEVVSYFSALTGSAGIGLPLMREWFDRPGDTLLQLDATPGVDKDHVLQAVRNAAPAGVQVYSGTQSLDAVAGAIRQGSAVANAVWMIVVLIAAIGLLNTLTLSVLERRREIGVLRAIGASRRVTLRMILAEAAGIGAVGGVLGLLFGLAAQYFFDSAAPDFMSIDIGYTPGLSVLVFAGAAVGLSLLGSVPPARRAARLNIIDAISID
ncbi:FtsX-like permease family protein [Nocardia stercoris]|uniref:FtsX-like permease family protein n=1 Tax=Nocardia stercoris TaxID=2483361 RepID=A0A3M2L5D6_9NOCA|nr:FtsX-like permease family protein [Nocardia stercoris]RMI32604.1 FtsX-like permease family protein [Nocardia stercoris]